MRRHMPTQRRMAVALLAEGVDRNHVSDLFHDMKIIVALLAEGVDRNPRCCVAYGFLLSSPSSRRAWIEIE